MGVFALALHYVPSDLVTFSGALYNLFFATLGNIVGGALFVAGSYLYLNKSETEQTVKPIRHHA